MLQARLAVFLSFLTLISAIDHCQPGNLECWPTESEIEAFKSSLSTQSNDCLESFPTFTSQDEEGDSVMNSW